MVSTPPSTVGGFPGVLEMLGLWHESPFRFAHHYFVYESAAKKKLGRVKRGFAMLWHDEQDMNGLKSSELTVTPIWEDGYDSVDRILAAFPPERRLDSGKIQPIECLEFDLTDADLRKKSRDLRLWVREFHPPDFFRSTFDISLGLTTASNSSRLYKATGRSIPLLSRLYRIGKLLPEERLFGTLALQAAVLTKDDYLLFRRSSAPESQWLPSCELELNPLLGSFPPDAVRLAISNDMGLSARVCGSFNCADIRFVAFGREWGDKFNVIAFFIARLDANSDEVLDAWARTDKLQVAGRSQDISDRLLIPAGSSEQHRNSRHMLYDWVSGRAEAVAQKRLEGIGCKSHRMPANMGRPGTTAAIHILMAMAQRWTVPMLRSDVQAWSSSTGSRRRASPIIPESVNLEGRQLHSLGVIVVRPDRTRIRIDEKRNKKLARLIASLVLQDAYFRKHHTPKVHSHIPYEVVVLIYDDEDYVPRLYSDGCKLVSQRVELLGLRRREEIRRRVYKVLELARKLAEELGFDLTRLYKPEPKRGIQYVGADPGIPAPLMRQFASVE
jgi:hypothetical protein